MTANNPWLGLKSYEESDRLYGRSKEADELANIVINSFHTIIYGKSGIGKTSLLRAGVFPTLRYEDFMPIYIRLEHMENAEEEYYLRQIEEIVGGEHSHASSPDDVCCDNVCPSETHVRASLHNIFSSVKSSKSRGIELMPVFVFDQFEEIFTLNENRDLEAVNRFFSDLSDILNRESDGLNYRIVICLREDYLYYIERLSESIPAFKRNRYCLQDLTHDEALEVIKEPCPGMVDDAVAQEILRKLSPESAGEVNATILSLYMSQIYDKMVKSGDSVISSSLIRQFGDDIISAFYFSSIEGVSEKSIEYLEDHLITTGGYRHNVPLEDAVVAGVKQNELDRLKERRIITIQPKQGNVLYMEYAHDVLCPIIVSNREQRTLRKRTKRLRRIVAAWVVFVLLLGSITTSFILQNRHITQERDAMKLMQSRAIASQAERLYEEGDYGKGVALCLRALTEDLSNPDRPISYEALVTLTKSMYGEFACCKKVIRHGEYKTSGSFSPDGKYFVTSANDSTARIWSVETGELVRVLKDNSGYVFNAYFSPDGKSVLISTSEDIKIWDAATGKLTKTITQKGTCDVEYSKDGRLIVTSSSDTVIRVWDAKSGKLLKTLISDKKIIGNFSITHDGKYLMTHDYNRKEDDNSITFWIIETGKQINTINCEPYFSETIPNEHIVATVFYGESGIGLWDMETGKLVKKIGDKMYFDAAISPDGSKIMVTGVATEFKGGAYIFDIKTGKEVMSFPEDYFFSKPSFSPDGKQVAVFTRGYEGYKGNTIWNIENGQCVKSIAGDSKAHFSSDGRYILTDGEHVALWDIKQKDNVRRVDFEGKEFPYCSSIVCPDGKNLHIAIQYGDTITIANAVTGKFVRSFPTGLSCFIINGLSPDAHYVALYDVQESIIQYWDTRSGKCVYMSDNSSGNRTFSPNGRYAVFMLGDDLTLVDISQGKQIQVIKKDSGYIKPLLFTPDCSRLVAYFSSDSTIREYDVATGKKVKFYEEKCPSAYCATYTSDGKCLAVSTDKIVVLWDVATGKVIQKINYDVYGGGPVSFSPDNRYMIVTADCNEKSQFAEVFEVKSGQKIAELNLQGSQYASFTPDGKNIVTNRVDGAFVWRFFEPQEIIDHFRKVVGDYQFTPEEETKYYLK